MTHVQSSGQPNPVLKAVDASARWACALGIAAFTAIIFYVVFARWVLSSTPGWAEELPRILLVWTTFLGAVSGFARGSHFRAGLLPLFARSERVQSWVRLAMALCSAIFLAVIGYTGWQLAMLTWSNGTTALDLPVGLFYLALPVSAVPALIALAAGGAFK
ncbi:TRAP transporter small permease [Nitratireductor sp. CH_MIT9313-5]|jgi:TRAP-type C4-dicarboxylate transport system permease small subunit|uniref:TRAP transporter small permease n=1 Tax=Nitratireductor sp. CH_MIT9313-5 TaxID=3107764 RepID=UPI0030083975